MLRHRWQAVLAAVAFIAVVEVIVDTVLDAALPSPWRTILVTALMTVTAGILVWFTTGQIERLRTDLLERNDALRSRNAALRALYQLSLSVADQSDPDQTISEIVAHTRRLLRVEGALLALDTSAGRLALRATSAQPGVLESASDGDTPAAYDELDCFLRPEYRIVATAPVKHGDRRLGTLALACSAPRQLQPAERETLSALATQVGLSIEAARIQDELQELAVQRERERIARDMHDGLAQVLGYVTTKSQAVSQLLADNRVPEATRQLGELEAAARDVFSDVREAILNLSGATAPEKGIGVAIREYADNFADAADLDLTFRATPEAESAPLSAAAQAEVYSIAREALTNVRKHARASEVEIGMRRTNGEVVLTIKDDGVGFEPELLSAGRERWPHFGLAGMRERAESVGGKIAWHSKPGAGTEVELHVPVGGTTRRHALERSTPLHETDGAGPPHQAVRSSAEGGSEAD